jgi:hypothetical protein
VLSALSIKEVTVEKQFKKISAFNCVVRSLAVEAVEDMCVVRTGGESAACRNLNAAKVSHSLKVLRRVCMLLNPY